jgi:hypothetical protein
MPLRRREHVARFGRVVRHARLAEHVQALVERRERDVFVHVRPRADQHGVEAARREQLLPIRIRVADAELVGSAPARFERAVRDRDQLDARLAFEPGTCTELTMPPAPMMPTRIGLSAAAAVPRSCESSADGAKAAAIGNAAEDRNARRFSVKPRPESDSSLMIPQGPRSRGDTIAPSLKLCRKQVLSSTMRSEGGHMKQRRISLRRGGGSRF